MQHFYFGFQPPNHWVKIKPRNVADGNYWIRMHLNLNSHVGYELNPRIQQYEWWCKNIRHHTSRPYWQTRSGIRQYTNPSTMALYVMPSSCPENWSIAGEKLARSQTGRHIAPSVRWLEMNWWRPSQNTITTSYLRLTIIRMFIRLQTVYCLVQECKNVPPMTQWKIFLSSLQTTLFRGS